MVVSGDSGKDTGDYTLKLAGKGNYTGTAEQTWTIYPFKVSGVQNTRIYKDYDGTKGIEKTDKVVGCTVRELLCYFDCSTLQSLNLAGGASGIDTFLWRALGKPSGSSAAFTDVPSGAYYAKAVAWAAENDVTTGVGGGRFAPDDTCTRAQIVTFLYRCMR